MAKFTCPYCMNEYDKKEVLYVCPDCGIASVPKFLEREPIKCKTPDCTGRATLRKCPKCGEVIPKTALETPNLPFSIIGVTNSGKTNYITVMLHELGRAPGLKLALGAQTMETRDHQNENYLNIYEQHRKPASTESTAVGGRFLPQIWYIKNLQKKHGDIVPTYTFTIFDGAGEDCEHRLDPSSTECRYINASKAIILVLDPLILANIRKGGIVDPTVMQNSLSGSEGEYKNAVDVVNSVASYVKAAQGIRSDKKLTIPVAVVLTKFDTILNHHAFAANALVKRPSLTMSDGQVNMGEIQQIDEEIKTWLCEIGESSFIDAVSSNFKEFCFFGTSSYGAPPKDKDTLCDDIRPHRVLDPVLWLFKKAGFVD